MYCFCTNLEYSGGGEDPRVDVDGPESLTLFPWVLDLSLALGKAVGDIGFSKDLPKKDKVPPPSSKPAKSGGGKQKKKKWSKGKQKEKVNNMVLFDQATYDKLLTEAPKFKLITPSINRRGVFLQGVFV
ncbi:40S ribosomal protein S25 [Raphanus sativus]|nr:40S ribosomal protein S25 [Raphanus sativus]